MKVEISDFEEFLKSYPVELWPALGWLEERSKDDADDDGGCIAR